MERMPNMEREGWRGRGREGGGREGGRAGGREGGREEGRVFRNFFLRCHVQTVRDVVRYFLQGTIPFRTKAGAQCALMGSGRRRGSREGRRAGKTGLAQPSGESQCLPPRALVEVKHGVPCRAAGCLRGTP